MLPREFLDDYTENLHEVQQAIDPDVNVALFSIWDGISKRGISPLRPFMVHALLKPEQDTEPLKHMMAACLQNLFPDDFENLDFIMLPFYNEIIDLFCDQSEQTEAFRTWAYSQYLKGLEVAAYA